MHTYLHSITLLYWIFIGLYDPLKFTHLFRPKHSPAILNGRRKIPPIILFHQLFRCKIIEMCAFTLLWKRSLFISIMKKIRVLFSV